MPSLSKKQQYQDAIDAARCNLELAAMLLNDLPDNLDKGLKELVTTKLCVNEALLASRRLGLEIGMTGALPQNWPMPQLTLVPKQEKSI
jgi:hypothetical protein